MSQRQGQGAIPGQAQHVKAFGLASGAAVAALIFSVATTKCIAILAGPEGMGLMGVYRNLGSAVGNVIGLGYFTFLLQRVAAARSRIEHLEIIGAAALLLILQFIAVLLLALFAAGILGWWMFGSGIPFSTLEIRIVLVMAFLNTALTTLRSLMNRSGGLKSLTVVQLATASASFALIFPLLRIGHVGLAINVGSGSLVGLGFAGFFLWKDFGVDLFSLRLQERLRALISMAAPSSIFFGQSLLMTGSLLLSQAVIVRHFGIVVMGLFSAATLIIDTAVMVITSSAKPHFLPLLNQISDESERQHLFSRMMSLLIGIFVIASVGVLCASRIIVNVLFSRQFIPAADMLAVAALSLLGQALGWSYHVFLLHRGDNRRLIVLDLMNSLIFAVFLLIIVRFKQDNPICLAWAYTLSSLAWGLLYCFVSVQSHGNLWLSGRNVRLLSLGAIWVSCEFVFVYSHLWTPAMIVAVVPMLPAIGWLRKSKLLQEQPLVVGFEDRATPQSSGAG